MQIHLLSGAIHSGKTTWLMEHFIPQHACFGIVSPVLEDGRYFYSIESGALKKMEANSHEKDIFQIGRYVFSKAAFQWSIEQIELGLKNPKDFLILDEIGPLELKGEGFAPFLKKLLSDPACVKNILLVVREQAVTDVCAYFKLNPKEINQLTVNVKKVE